VAMWYTASSSKACKPAWKWTNHTASKSLPKLVTNVLSDVAATAEVVKLKIDASVMVQVIVSRHA
jgi:hypothetical protein